MLLPLGLIRNLHMPMSRKLSIAALFCLGFICVIASTVRVISVGKSTNGQPSTTWLALWSIIESSIGK
jgi:hypothetical protein